MPFEFATARRIVFGPGVLVDVPALARALGRHALVVTGHDMRRAGKLVAALTSEGIGVATWSVQGEPTLQLVESGVRHAKATGCDFVVSIGGGSAIDAGKAIAAMLCNPGELLDYLEVVGRGRALENPSAPFMAIPTTSGTGSEATRNAVLASPEHRLKASLRSPHMLPTVALVDPELTYDLPPALTATTGLDALTQLIEGYVCNRANPMTDSLCAEGITRAARSLRRAFENGSDIAARQDMSLAALFSGIVLANAGLGAVHGFAGPLGGMFPAAPHGAICAALLPHATAANLIALRKQPPMSPPLARYRQVARWLTADPSAEPEHAVEWLEHTQKALRIPGLSAYGMAPEHAPEAAQKAARASSMKPNPVALTDEELRLIFLAAL